MARSFQFKELFIEHYICLFTQFPCLCIIAAEQENLHENRFALKIFARLLNHMKYFVLLKLCPIEKSFQLLRVCSYNPVTERTAAPNFRA